MEETTAASALPADPPVWPRDKWDKMLARMEDRMEEILAHALPADPPARPRDKWDKMLARMEERMEETRMLILAAAAAKEAECDGVAQGTACVERGSAEAVL